MRQFARFLVVGVGNTVVSFVAYRLLLAVGTPYALAAPLAFAVGAITARNSVGARCLVRRSGSAGHASAGHLAARLR